MNEFAGKTVFITGGASGIGKATAIAFAREGARIAIVTSTIVDEAERVAKQLEQDYQVQAMALRCDVRVESEVTAAVEAVIARFGTLDIAFNNAGVGPDGVTIPMAPLCDVTEQDWDWVCDVNLKGVFLCMKHELRQMRKQGKGCIVNTASTAGLKALPDFGAYGPSKAGMIQLTKAAALENVSKHIRCNVVCPGPTKGTRLSERSFGKNGEKLKGAPGGGPKMRSPEEIASVVLWLASDSCDHITGNVINADGGMDII